jgi:hypothetical protein
VARRLWRAARRQADCRRSRRLAGDSWLAGGPPPAPLDRVLLRMQRQLDRRLDELAEAEAALQRLRAALDRN